MKDKYKEVTGASLDITETSLAIEIIGHIYIDIFSKVLKLCPFEKNLKVAVVKLSNELTSHTDVIDCGEITVDDNRWLWD